MNSRIHHSHIDGAESIADEDASDMSSCGCGSVHADRSDVQSINDDIRVSLELFHPQDASSLRGDDPLQHVGLLCRILRAKRHDVRGEISNVNERNMAVVIVVGV